MLAGLKKGDVVDVTYDADRNITSLEAEEKPANTADSAPKGGGQRRGGGGGYNDDKRQAVIVFQSARNTATELVTAALSAGALALPAKKCDQFDVLQALVDTLTTRYYNENMEVFKTGELPEGFGDA